MKAARGKSSGSGMLRRKTPCASLPSSKKTVPPCAAAICRRRCSVTGRQSSLCALWWFLCVKPLGIRAKKRRKRGRPKLPLDRTGSRHQQKHHPRHHEAIPRKVIMIRSSPLHGLICVFWNFLQFFMIAKDRTKIMTPNTATERQPTLQSLEAPGSTWLKMRWSFWSKPAAIIQTALLMHIRPYKPAGIPTA